MIITTPMTAATMAEYRWIHPRARGRVGGAEASRTAVVMSYIVPDDYVNPLHGDRVFAPMTATCILDSTAGPATGCRWPRDLAADGPRPAAPSPDPAAPSHDRPRRAPIRRRRVTTGRFRPPGSKVPGVRLPAVVYRVYERRLIRGLVGSPIPHHVGVMLDGNRRWARKAGFDNVAHGHLVGAAHIADLLEWCNESGIGMVTLWLLSTDNLRRADDELQPLLEIITDVVDELAAPNRPWKLRMVGALDLLPA